MPSFAIFTATLPVAARAEGIGFLFDSIDVTTPSLRNCTEAKVRSCYNATIDYVKLTSRSGTQIGVPGLRTPSMTLSPMTIGFVRLKQASGTI